MVKYQPKPGRKVTPTLNGGFVLTNKESDISNVVTHLGEVVTHLGVDVTHT